MQRSFSQQNCLEHDIEFHKPLLRHLRLGLPNLGTFQFSHRRPRGQGYGVSAPKVGTSVLAALISIMENENPGRLTCVNIEAAQIRLNYSDMLSTLN